MQSFSGKALECQKKKIEFLQELKGIVELKYIYHSLVVF